MPKLVWLLVLTQALPAVAQRPGADCVCIERLSERVLLAYWLGTGRCNLTAIKSSKGLVIIDTEISPRVMAVIKARIEEEFGRNDWTYVINTHAHRNHAGGNAAFQSAKVIGHENLWQDMQWLVKHNTDPDARRQVLTNAALTLRNLRSVLANASDPSESRRIRSEITLWQLYGQDMREGFEVVRPAVTFTDRHTIDMGDLRLELVFYGRGHSLSDILIYVPEEKLLVTGAIAYQRNHIPEISEQSDMGDVERFLAVLDAFLAADVLIDHVVPSHSPPLVKRDLVCIREYTGKLLAGLRAACKEGLTVEEAAGRFEQRKVFPGFVVPPRGAWDEGFHERNIRNLWRILLEEESKASGN